MGLRTDGNASMLVAFPAGDLRKGCDMKIGYGLRQWSAWVVVAVVSLSVPAAWGQDDTSTGPIEYPLQVIHAASAERIITKADALFAAADRPELSDVMRNLIDTTLRGVKGMDRTKPFGMMVYIKPGLTPGISAVSYLPVSDIKELLLFLAGEAGVVRDVSGKDYQHEITENGWGPDLAVKVTADYAFMTSIDDATELSRRFPAPERLVSKLTSRYDIAYSLLLKNIPPAMKTLFIEFFKTQAEAGLQRRDEEPEAAYRIRRANGESLIDLLDMVVRQGDELTIGGFSNPEDQTGFIELELNGTKDSGLVKFCQTLAGRRSYFDPLVNEASTLTLNASVQLDEKRRKPFVELFSQASTVIADGLKEKGKPEASVAQTQPFFESLANTAKEGHLDLFVQLSGTEPGEYRVLGGLRVLGVGSFPKQLEDLLTFARNTVAELAAGATAKTLTDMKLSEFTVEGHDVHVLPLQTPPDAMGQGMFGETPNVYLCATPQALWFAFGQKSAQDHLALALSTIAKGPDPDQPKRPHSPFLFSTHASHWVQLSLLAPIQVEGQTVGDAKAPADRLEEPAVQPETPDPTLAAFTPDNDQMRLTGRPTDSGVRVRADFQSGYFQWFGGMISQQIDEGLAGMQRREERRARLEKRKLEKQ